MADPSPASDVSSWTLHFGSIFVQLDPYVIGSRPYQSPIWDVHTEFRIAGVSRKLTLPEATAAIERELTAIYEAIGEAMKGPKT